MKFLNSNIFETPYADTLLDRFLKYVKIHPGVHGGQHAVDRTKELLHSLHLHAVAGDKAGKAHFAAQQAGDDAAGHGGGHTAVIQRGEQDVRRHDVQ